MKRQRHGTELRSKRPSKRPRGVAKQPRRANAKSLVPLGTFGYRPNPIERKVNDISVATYQVHTTSTPTLLCLPVTGSDFNQRIGRKITIKSVYIRGRVGIQSGFGISTADSPSQQARFLIFADLQPNGAAPAVTDLLVSADPASQLNLNNRDRFVILSDKEYAFDPYSKTAAAGGQNGHSIANVKVYKKLNMEVIFNAVNGGSIADIQSGALYMLWLGSEASGAQDINAILSTRVRYTDY